MTELHPIAVEASTMFLQDGRTLSDASLARLTATLEGLHGSMELGPAIASLVQVAQHLEVNEKARAPALALLQVAMSQTAALEEVNELVRHASEDTARKKRVAFAKFSGQA